VAGALSQPLPEDSWTLREGQLLALGDVEGPELQLDLPLEGVYAVFASPVEACLLRFGDDDYLHTAAELEGFGEQFVGVINGSEQTLALAPSAKPETGLSGLALVPVTSASAETLLREAYDPPLPLHAIADWLGLSSHHERLQVKPSDYALQYMNHRQAGFTMIHWAAARGWLFYHSSLPNTNLIGGLQEGEVLPGAEWIMRYYPLLEQVDSLKAAIDCGHQYGADTFAYFGMNRHYGMVANGVLGDKFHEMHPEWHHRNKEGETDPGRISYFFPEARDERVALLLEAAERGAEGLTFDFCRQPPMMSYHPEMVDAFRRETGLEARELDASDGERWLEWCHYRAGFLTDIVRRVREGLRELEQRTGQRVRVAARVDSEGLLIDLAQGVEVEQMCREGLVDVLLLDCLSTSAGGYAQDVRPYLELGRETGVEVVGSNNYSTARENPVAYLRRAQGMVRAGVQGIEVYESEVVAGDTWRWLVPLMAYPERIDDFLANSNLEACFPIDSFGALAGFDNHHIAVRLSMWELPAEEGRGALY
jgi:hypothetical protein